MILTTTKCGEFGHPEFALEADISTVPEVYLKNVIDTIEGMVAQGSVFRPGESFQIGWMRTQVHARESGLLTLYEPDMQTIPIQWVSGITQTLRQMMLQLFMLDSVSLRGQMDTPTILQSLLTCSCYTESDFFMSRSAPSNARDSGWFVGCFGRKHDHNERANLQLVSLYDAFLHQPGIQGFLSFPVGTVVTLDQENGMRLIKDRNELTIEPGSFLDTWFQSRKTQ